MTFTPSTPWGRAMNRAIREGLKATRRTDGTFRVASISKPGTCHTVVLDDCGRIIHCSDCKGWTNGGRERPCKHAGAVAIALTFLGGHSIHVEQPETVLATVGTGGAHGANSGLAETVESFRPGRRQLLRPEMAR